ncbi:MAG: energy-coupling factor ABC transporter substrate-binding protein [Anaerolineae bacterium]|nr:energy-coupling factor ABC transporter substrate-binding protein [Anaerolineae bacterium]
MASQIHSQPKRLGTGAIILGIIAIIILMTIPLFLVPDSQFGGSDNAGSEAIAAIAPDYNSEWITNIWAPPGGETESMLFALQATVGGILIGYLFGYLRGRKTAQQTPPDKQ